ncbi:ROK family protein [Shewanella sp. GXUN23E]|uniref:ROK family protein n=1 Tax=Shewanella sp. GXUN23E TaxID=3422498 RepID=UPI003D7DBB27
MKIGIDLGGTKTELVMLSDDGLEVFRKRVISARTYAGALDVMTSLVTEAEQEVGVTATVGVGIPGVISPVSHLVKNANSTWLNGHPLDSDLTARLGRTVRVANDANCFALSEATDGAGAGANTVFGVILGTGCGAGFVTGGKVHRGVNAVAGEWGHNPLPWMTESEFRSRQCFCGKYDCIETFISGPALVSDYQDADQHSHNTQLNLSTVLRVEDIMARLAGGDAVAQAVFERYIDRLARALGHVINLLDPDVIVLGGGVSNISALYGELASRLPSCTVGGECRTQVVPNLYGASSGVRGAAWLWNDAEGIA